MRKPWARGGQAGGEGRALPAAAPPRRRTSTMPPHIQSVFLRTAIMGADRARGLIMSFAERSIP